MNTRFTKDDFWSMIQGAKDQFGQDNDAVVAWLTNQLTAQGADAALQFHIIMRSYLHIADVFGLWDAAYLLCNGYCSDDLFLYFRCWLIAQGKEIYFAVMKDPDALVEVETYAGCTFETLGYVGAEVYKKLTGKDAYDDASDAMCEAEINALSSEVVCREGIIYPRDMPGIATYYPRLWAKYGHRMPKTGCHWNTEDPAIYGLLVAGRRADLERARETPEAVSKDRPLVLKKYGETYQIRMRINTYVDFNNLAIERDALIDGIWQDWDTLTVNLIPCWKGPNYAFLDTNNCGQDCVEWLVKNGFGMPTGVTERSGFCSYPEFCFSENKLREVDAEGYEDHIEQWESCYHTHENSPAENAENEEK